MIHTSQLSTCTQCQSISALYRQVDCSVFQLTRNNWTNQSYGTKLYYDSELLKDLLKYKRILEKKMINSNYLNITASKLASLLATRMYKPVGCPECGCSDFTDFIHTSSSTSTLPSSTTTTIPSSTTTTLPISTTTTTLPPITNPVVACGDEVAFGGGPSFPAAYEITLGSGTGVVTLNYDTFAIPDKMIILFDGVEVINLGYRGSSTYQIALDNTLTNMGLPTETIQGIGLGVATFNKNTATTKAYIYIFAPLPSTGWTFTLSCPV